MSWFILFNFPWSHDLGAEWLVVETSQQSWWRAEESEPRMSSIETHANRRRRPVKTHYRLVKAI